MVTGSFNQRFSVTFLSVFVRISGFTEPITLIWASLESLVLQQNLSTDDVHFSQR